MSGFKMNDRVFHPIFGLGTVLEDESAARLKVRFDNKGDTWLALEHAMLGQRAWRVRATVLRSLETDEDIDLDILVTEKVWGNEMPPMVGGDMEGHLWLQGYLWAAPR